MSSDLEAYLRDPEPVEPGDYTALERQALEEVLKLSSEAVEPIESRIESEYQLARQKAQERFDREMGQVGGEFQTQTEELQREHETRIDEARTDFEDRLSSLKVETQQRRKRVMQMASELESKAETEHQERTMVAEFVAEGAVTKRKQGKVEANSNAEQTRLQLDALQTEADRLVRLYRQPALTSGSRPAPAEENYVNPAEALRSQQALAEKHLDALRRLRVGQLFAGVYPVLVAGGLLASALVLLSLLYLLDVSGLPSIVVTAPVVALLTLVLIVLAGRALWQRTKKEVQRLYSQFQEAVARARLAADQQREVALQRVEQEWRAAMEQKLTELKRAQDALAMARTNVARQRKTSLREIEDHRQETLQRLRDERDRVVREAEQAYQDRRSRHEQQFERDKAAIQGRYDEEMGACESQYRSARRSLEERWDRGLDRIVRLLEETDRLDAKATGEWQALLGDAWTPPEASPCAARFATLDLDPSVLADSVQARAKSRLDATKHVRLPALLELPDHGSLLLEYPREGRQQAIDTLRAVMLRLFLSFPPGQARFTILDPVGLGESFAGFMHAGDYMEPLIGSRIWTEPAQIQEQLEDLTQHMETVIQKYLRNEFETIEEYNQQAGELAEPYRFLVIADFPTNFSEESARRLSSIVHSGPRCGVHTLIAYDTRADFPSGVDIHDITAGSVHLRYEKGQYIWQDAIFRQYPVALDRPPDEETLTRTMHVIGKAGVESSRVEVPFAAIAPAEDQYWSLDSREELRVPLGRTGATRLQYLLLGRGVAQHLLIAGKTGSGKSTLLHVMVTNLALWYSPDDVEVYLIDFKQGVEFKTYATHDLPHGRAVAIESDREFGLSILRRLDAEMTRRGDIFREAGVQDIATYRKTTGTKMPRTVLIVDEFQVFFADDDKLAQDAAVLLEQLVRQGRAFGIHVVLGSQTLGGVFGLTRSTIGQMAVRIALQCSEADSQLILDDENVAARLLSRPGEAIYNDVGGSVAGNSPFQTAWLPDSQRDKYLSRLRELQRDRPDTHERLIVFEGSVPADITQNRQLAASLDGTGRRREVSVPRIWLGAPVTIKEPTAVALRRQSGANLLMIGQRDDVAMNLMNAAVVSLAAQLPASSSQFVIMDGSPPDAPQAGALEHVMAAIPHTTRNVAWRDVADTIGELAAEVDKRIENDQHSAPAIFLLVYGVQRYRMLRRSEDAFGLSLDEEEKARPDAQFATILREGPNVGVHVLLWADTLSTLERTLDRQTIRQFDHRVLFQMSAADSSNLIDSPAANQLGLHRALLYSEEQGGIERFRPYAAPREDWLDQVRRKLAPKPAASKADG